MESLSWQQTQQAGLKPLIYSSSMVVAHLDGENRQSRVHKLTQLKIDDPYLLPSCMYVYMYTHLKLFGDKYLIRDFIQPIWI